MNASKKLTAAHAAPSLEEIRAVSPALAQASETILRKELWKRPELSPRDRSLVTIAALIARAQAVEMPSQFALALDHGLTPAELSETITHLAFYAGWANAMTAVHYAGNLFAHQGVGVNQLPPAQDRLLPLNEQAEAERAMQVSDNFGAISPGLVQNTTDLLFRDLWLRPALAPRDRSLITVSALIANGQTAQIPYHLNRAMDNGLGQGQASEVLTQLAFYSGWPCAFSALPVFKEVFEKRHQ